MGFIIISVEKEGERGIKREEEREKRSEGELLRNIRDDKYS